MNPLESLKSQLRAKPATTEQLMKKIKVKVPIESKPQKIDIESVKIEDLREENADFDISKLTKKLLENKLAKVKEVVPKSNVLEEEKEKEEETFVIKPKTKAKKLKKPLLKIVEELEDEQEGEKEIQPIEFINLEEKEEVAPIEAQVEVEKSKKRRTVKPVKGVSVLNPEEWVEINGENVVERLPKKQPNVIYKVSSYYMNNREIFMNFINSLFGPYREQVLDESNPVTCDTIGNIGEDISLLTHQKIVRDYLNLYTPYRGLLLFHGLGSGKSLSSIAIAEGMKSSKNVVVLLPASLKPNYLEELKKGGDPIYKLNQFWEWISIVTNPEALETLSSVLSLPVEYINRKKGAWLVNAKENESNYESLDPNEKKSLNEQLDEMINSKYQFINYNGIRRDKFRVMSDNFERNIFDNKVVIIDEAHNFVSRIVNKLGKERPVPIDKTGKTEKVSIFLSLIMYEMLLRAENVRIVLLSGTPIINYPNEIGIMFNILRGYIKTWEIPLDVKTTGRVNQAEIERIFANEKIHDYIEYSASNKKLMITRNPFGFESKIKKDSGYHGVTNKEGEKRDPITGKVVFYERGQATDEEFERKIIRLLRDNQIDVIHSGIKIDMYKALPDKIDDFLTMFVDSANGSIKNVNLFKRRIMGLTSYFRSAQEGLLPRYEKLADFKVIKIQMSDYQFNIYELARSIEREQDERNKNKKGKIDENGIYKEPTSTYRIFSRLYCNFVMPRPPGRPMPDSRLQKSEPFICPEVGDEEEPPLDEREVMLNKLIKIMELFKKKQLKESNDLNEEDDQDKDGDSVLEEIGDKDYPQKIKDAFDCLKKNSSKYLSKTALEKYSPKFLNILENIEDPEHIGNHLLYSQFRTFEGIGIFTLVLDYNGFTRFKIKKDSNDEWVLDISPENRGKPTYALYTGTESKDEKEMILKIYNGKWPEKAKITEQLKEIANNNNMGEIIKVFVISASGSEGINLFNTRYVHIMEPYWNPARIDQVVGRARRICSHKSLPEALQTVEVFLYLMTFSPKQIASDGAIELKLKDKSKKKYPVSPGSSRVAEIPFTTDEALYEISNIKEEVSEKLLTAIKESSIDCAVYSRVGSKEKLHCLQFPDAKSSSFSYVPSITKEQPDTAVVANKKVIEWRGTELTLRGKKYIARKISRTTMNIYDLDSYNQALLDPKVDPVLIGVIETDERGTKTFKKI
uniref:Helicase ATP-binding domain-containing protein n=1 Tax=viral metagenome TaxID=1070528 RepID=A0A6C0KY44_9ZZZZ